MCADNPWKRQMMNSNAGNAGSPAPTTPPATGGTPSEPVNPWKAKQQQTAATTSGPSWMKQPATDQPANNTAPWAKPQPQQDTAIAGDNPWKKSAFGANKIEGFKEKKQREERERLEKENEEKMKKEQERLEQERLEQEKLQQERLERERLERERLARQEEERLRQLKEKELRNEARELRVMAAQDLLSAQRQKQDKAEAEARLKKQPKRPNAAKAKPNPIGQVSSPRKQPRQQFSNSRKVPQTDCPASHYLDAFQQLFQRFESYRERLDCQKELLRIYTEFKQSASRRFKQLVDEHDSKQARQLKIVEEGVQYTLALASSRIENDQTLYDLQSIKRLRYKMQLYDLLQNSLLSMVKKIGVLKIRLPMVVMLEYRGIACLAMAVTEEEQDEPAIDVLKVRQAGNDFELLQKEVKKVCPKFNMSMLECKRLSHPEADTFMLYMKEQSSRVLEPRPAIKKEHLETIDWLLNPQLKTFSAAAEHLRKLESSVHVKELVDCMLLAKCVNTIYSSCQAEVEELHLFNLVIRQDEGIWQLIRKLGHVETLPQRGFLLKLFEVYSGVSFEYNDRVFEEGLQALKELRVRERGYSFDRLEFIEITNNYDRYLKDGKLELAGESILLRYELAQLRQNPHDRINLVLDHVELLTLQEKHEQALEELLKIEVEVPEWQPGRIRHLSLLFKTYSLLSNEPELLQTFERLLREINFNLGTDNPLHVYLYSVLAYFYSSRRLTESVNLYQLALSVATKLYGANSQACGDISVDIAKAFLKNNKLDDADYHLEQAMKIYGDNRPKTAETLAVASRVHFLKKDNSAAFNSIDRAIKIYQKLDRSNELFELLRLKLGYLQDDAPARYRVIDAMLELGLSHNNRTLAKKAFELALKEELPRVSRSRRERLLQISSDEYASTQLLPGGEFELHRKNFPSVCELLRWALSLLEPSSGQLSIEKGELIFADVLSYFQAEELTKLFT